MTAPVIIIGSGLAGVTVARELRKLSPEQAITLICADVGELYSKPSLSNALAAGKSAAALVQMAADVWTAPLKLNILTQEAVTRIDTAAHTVYTAQGSYPYSALVLATGAHPIRLPLQGDGAAEVLSVNHISDYAAFRERLLPGQQVAILGGGLIGCEFANDLAAAGWPVTVFDVASQPLGHMLPARAGAYLRTKLEAAGVTFNFATQMAAVEKQGEAYVLRTDTGETFQADLVLSAVGLSPATELAAAAGIKVDRGIVTDQFLQTNASDVYALGDCASVCGLLLPYVMPIMQAGRALAKTLAGERTAVTYPAMPVMVKTPACPTIVCPPAMNAAGEWQETETADGVKAVFVDVNQSVLGFALLGAATAERQQLASQTPPRLA